MFISGKKLEGGCYGPEEISSHIFIVKTWQVCALIKHGVKAAFVSGKQSESAFDMEGKVYFCPGGGGRRRNRNFGGGVPLVLQKTDPILN